MFSPLIIRITNGARLTLRLVKLRGVGQRFSLCNTYFYTGKGVALSLLISTVTEISKFITDHLEYKSKSTSRDVDIENDISQKCLKQ